MKVAGRFRSGLQTPENLRTGLGQCSRPEPIDLPANIRSIGPVVWGQKTRYLAVEKVVHLANEIFGFNRRSSAILHTQTNFVSEPAQPGKVLRGLMAIVRVTLKDGTYRQDVGYGQIETCKGQASAFAKAEKEGGTDALSGAVQSFGK